MAQIGQFAAHLFAIAALYLHGAIIGKTARRIDGGLRIHAKIDHIRNKARMPVGLIGPAHHAKGHHDFTILAQHARNDRVHGALIAAQFVGMAFLQGKARPAVLQQDAKFFRCDARSEAVENRVNQADRHAVAINHGDIDRVFMHRFTDRRGRCHGCIRVDQGGQLRGRFGGQHMIEARGMIGICDKAVARVIGQLCGLGLDMGALAAEGIHARNVEMRQDIQHQNRGGALAVWRVLDQFHLLVGARHRGAGV